jgi:hypothetical protein
MNRRIIGPVTLRNRTPARIYLYRGTEDTALTKDLLHKD